MRTTAQAQAGRLLCILQLRGHALPTDPGAARLLRYITAFDGDFNQLFADLMVVIPE